MSSSPTNQNSLPEGPAQVRSLWNGQDLDQEHTGLILKTKARIAGNALRFIKKHLYLHIIVGFGLVFFLFFGGTWFFSYLFRFLMAQDVFGPPLMERLVGIVLMIFFFMLLFSNLIITLSTTYISREVDFLMALPISRQSIFRQKLIESVFYSSWAFGVLSLPLFISYGISRGATWEFYPLVFLLVIPFLIIPAAIGSIVTMIVTAILPARKTRALLVVLGIMSIFLMLVVARVTGIGKLFAQADQSDILQIMNVLAFGNNPIMPSAWLSSALAAIAPVHPGDFSIRQYLYWLAMLTSTGLFLLEVTRWLVPPLYYRGWCLSKDSAVREVESNAKISPFQFLDGIIEKVFRSETAALLSKDLKCFWRDPAQWTQLVILLGLMIIYVFNLGWSQNYNEAIAAVVDNWKTILSLFNLAATCFILSIMTTRFVFPMLSLEGRGFWTVGLAPIDRTKVVWQKYLLCLLLCVSVAIPLVFLSNLILKVEDRFYWIGYLIALLMSFGLSSLSVGTSALLPDFNEDNPARIANGVGGTLNVITSLAYIAITVGFLAFPTISVQTSESAKVFFENWIVLYSLLFILIQAIFIILPMHFGLKRWKNLEF